MKPRKKLPTVVACAILAALVAADGAAASEAERDGRLIVTQSFRTILTTTTSTTSVPATCAGAISTDACKRRRRSFNKAYALHIEDGDTSTLDGSLGFEKEPALEDSSSDREGRVAYSIYWTSTSTFTVLSTSTVASTITISYACSIVGGTYPAAC